MPHAAALPGTNAPALKLAALSGGPIDLAQERPENFTLVFFYRGVHCPICKKQLEEINARLPEFAEHGLSVLAVSMDDEERAQRQATDWDIGNMKVGYGMSADTARAWGLYLSQKEKEAEPDLFSEPGLAVVYPNGRLYALYQQSVPFARPRLDDLFQGLAFIVEKNYPARGTVAA